MADAEAARKAKKARRRKGDEADAKVAAEEQQARQLERLLFGARDEFLQRLETGGKGGGDQEEAGERDVSFEISKEKRRWADLALELGEEGGDLLDAAEGEDDGGFADDVSELEQDEEGEEDPSLDGAFAVRANGSAPLAAGPVIATRGRLGGSRAPAWVDDEDAQLGVNIARSNRLRKLRTSEDEVTIAGTDYEARLRAQHQRLNPGTSWAQLPSAQGKGKDAKVALQRARTGVGMEGVEEDDEEDEEESVGDVAELLLRSGKALIGRSAGHGGRLQPGRVELTRLRNANQEDPSKAVVRSVQFHPISGQLLLTAGLDKRLRLFQVNGKENPKLQSVYFQDMPIYKASFCRGGAQVLLAGRRQWYYVYDVVAGATERVQGIVGHEERSFESFAASPKGDLVAFLCNEGYVALVSLKSRQWVGDLKLNGSVRCAAFTSNGTQLVASGGDGEIYHWDVGTRRCLHRGRDEGALHCTSLALSPNDQYMASGSGSGVVNVYNRQEFLSGNLRPLKALMNLTTTIDTLAFNPDSQLLAVASRMKKDAMRLVHIPTCRVYSNWPTPQTPLQYVHSLDFSSSRGMFVVGNAKGDALLYRLHHYSKV